MSITKPTVPPARRAYVPTRPSRVRIAAIWFALLLGSFLFGMLIISPLLGVVLSNPEQEKQAPASPQRAAPTARTSSVETPSSGTGLRVEDRVRERPQPGPGIRLSPDDVESRVEASDAIPTGPSTRPESGQPLGQNAVTLPPVSGGLSVEEVPNSAGQPQEDRLRGQ